LSTQAYPWFGRLKHELLSCHGLDGAEDEAV
jgi:hypothetical protein